VGCIPSLDTAELKHGGVIADSSGRWAALIVPLLHLHSHMDAYNEEDRQRDDLFLHAFMASMLNPELIKFMEAMQKAQSSSSQSGGSWDEYQEPAADECITQLERALELVGDGNGRSGGLGGRESGGGDGSGSSGGGGSCTCDPEPSLAQLMKQLGFAESLSEEQEQGLAAAPAVVTRLCGEVEAALERMRSPDGAGFLSQ